MKNLSAERVGDRVLLRWTTPSQTTDGIAIPGPMMAEVCREEGERPLTPAARTAACAPVHRAAVTPGPSEVADPLPASLQKGPPVLLTYRVRIDNASGRSAGESTAAIAAGGPAPAPVQILRATATEGGVVLEWRPGGSGGDYIDITRTDLTLPLVASKATRPPPPRPPGRDKTSASRQALTQPGGQVVHLVAADILPTGRSESAGTIDATAAMGETYTYVAERARKLAVDGHLLEVRSDPAPSVTVALRDTFPPRPPTGLATIPGFTRPDASGVAVPYIDLSWEPNGEADLSGYLVYRQLARSKGDPQGPLARLTPLPIPAPAYRDVAVRPGQRYIYHVTAVDASGNESAPSAKALEILENP